MTNLYRDPRFPRTSISSDFNAGRGRGVANLAREFLYEIKLSNSLDEKIKYGLAPPRHIPRRHWFCRFGPTCNKISSGLGVVSYIKLKEERELRNIVLPEHELAELEEYSRLYHQIKEKFGFKQSRDSDEEVLEPFVLIQITREKDFEDLEQVFGTKINRQEPHFVCGFHFGVENYAEANRKFLKYFYFRLVEIETDVPFPSEDEKLILDLNRAGPKKSTEYWNRRRIDFEEQWFRPLLILNKTEEARKEEEPETEADEVEDEPFDLSMAEPKPSQSHMDNRKNR